MNEVSQVKRFFIFKNTMYWFRFLLDSGKYQGLFGLAMDILARSKSRIDVFSNRVRNLHDCI